MIQREFSGIVCPRMLSIHSRQRQEKEQAKKSLQAEGRMILRSEKADPLSNTFQIRFRSDDLVEGAK